MARGGILEDVLSGNVQYETADRSKRWKLICVFIVALQLLILCAVAGVKQASRQANLVKTIGWVVSVRNSGGKNGSKYATVEYFVDAKRYVTEVSCDSRTRIGDNEWIYYSMDYPERAEKKASPFIPAIICLFQLWLMFRTGIPSYLCGVLMERKRFSPRRTRGKKRDADPWEGWRD